MLSLGIIVLLALIYVVLMFAMLRAQRAKRAIRERPRVRERRLTTSRSAEERLASASADRGVERQL